MLTLKQRVSRLERYHRNRHLRRALKIGLVIALVLLFLWLLHDIAHLMVVVDGLQREVSENSERINGLHTQVGSLANQVNNVAVKINGQQVVQQQTPQVTTPIHNSVNFNPIVPSGILGGLLAIMTRILPLAVA